MSNPTLVVMAAGIGRRYGGLKQIDPIGPAGEIILDYSVYDALRAGFESVVFVISQEIEGAFRDRVGKTIERQVETRYVFQELADVPDGFEIPADRQKPWGTGHATLSCRHVVRSPFAVINADDFYGRSSFQALGDYLRDAQDRHGVYNYCMVGYVLENTLSAHGHVARGVCEVDAGGFLVDVHERTRIQRFNGGVKYSDGGESWVELSAASVVSMNMWGFTPSLFGELEARFAQFLRRNRARIRAAEYFLPDVIGELVQENVARVKVLPTDERWYGITYQEDKPRVKEAIRALIRQGAYPEQLWG
jgi:hypothetical protein